MSNVIRFPVEKTRLPDAELIALFNKLFTPEEAFKRFVLPELVERQEASR